MLISIHVTIHRGLLQFALNTALYTSIIAFANLIRVRRKMFSLYFDNYFSQVKCHIKAHGFRLKCTRCRLIDFVIQCEATQHNNASNFWKDDKQTVSSKDKRTISGETMQVVLRWKEFQIRPHKYIHTNGTSHSTFFILHSLSLLQK